MLKYRQISRNNFSVKLLFYAFHLKNVLINKPSECSIFTVASSKKWRWATSRRSCLTHLHSCLRLHERWSWINYNSVAWSLSGIFMTTSILCHHTLTLPLKTDINIFPIRCMPTFRQQWRKFYEALHVFTAWIPQCLWYGTTIVSSRRSCQRIRNKFKPNIKWKGFPSSRRIMHCFV
jgi:hypothetical protein